MITTIQTQAQKILSLQRFNTYMDKLPDHIRPAAMAYCDAIQKFENEDYSDLVMEKRNIQWQGEWLPVDKAVQQLELVPEYENFRGKRLADYFTHNAQMFEAVRFGREYSPVVYVKLRNSNDKHQFINRMRAFRANEIMERPDGSIRVWWD